MGTAVSAASETGRVRAEERLWAAVSSMTRLWLRRAREEARSVGLSLPQLFLIGGLKETGPIPVSRWVELVGSSPSAATGLLDGLEAAGVLARSHDPSDRRQVLISLTPQGQRLSFRLYTEMRRSFTAYCDGVPGDDLRSSAATLERIVAHALACEGLPSEPHPSGASARASSVRPSPRRPRTPRLGRRVRPAGSRRAA